MTLPDVVVRKEGNYTSMGDYAQNALVPSIKGMKKPSHHRNATPILSSVREQPQKRNNFMSMVENDMNKTARHSEY